MSFEPTDDNEELFPDIQCEKSQESDGEEEAEREVEKASQAARKLEPIVLAHGSRQRGRSGQGGGARRRVELAAGLRVGGFATEFRSKICELAKRREVGQGLGRFSRARFKTKAGTAGQ